MKLSYQFAMYCMILYVPIVFPLLQTSFFHLFSTCSAYVFAPKKTATSLRLPPRYRVRFVQGARGDALWQGAPLSGSIALVNQRHPRPQQDIGQQDLGKKAGRGSTVEVVSWAFLGTLIWHYSDVMATLRWFYWTWMGSSWDSNGMFTGSSWDFASDCEDLANHLIVDPPENHITMENHKIFIWWITQLDCHFQYKPMDKTITDK